MAFVYGAGLVSCALLSSSITNPFLMYTFQRGLQIRVAFTSMIYNKVQILTYKIRKLRLFCFKWIAKILLNQKY